MNWHVSTSLILTYLIFEKLFRKNLLNGFVKLRPAKSKIKKKITCSEIWSSLSIYLLRVLNYFTKRRASSTHFYDVINTIYDVIKTFLWRHQDIIFFSTYLDFFPSPWTPRRMNAFSWIPFSDFWIPDSSLEPSSLSSSSIW